MEAERERVARDSVRKSQKPPKEFVLMPTGSVLFAGLMPSAMQKKLRGEGDAYLQKFTPRLMVQILIFYFLPYA